MTGTGVALDLGTSGFRGQALALEDGDRIVSTAVTARHPLPGANVMDHLHFALEMGVPQARRIMVDAVNQVIEALGGPARDITRLAVCGNPIQLSLFQGLEIRDLAYAGERKLAALGVTPPSRDARILGAGAFEGLNLPPEARVLIPPAVRHEIGADALAMLLQTGILSEKRPALITDYGTNAEMALIVDGTVFTGSTAAGPALEGQQISDGILALPGAISDVVLKVLPGESPGNPSDLAEPDSRSWELLVSVLDPDMLPGKGGTVDPSTGRLLAKGDLVAAGITGTGVVALISEALEGGLIRIPKILTRDREIFMPDGIRFGEKDLVEAGKAFGAIRAGHVALCHAAGIELKDVETAYMAGAAGTYVDAAKARAVGMIPGGVRTVHQVGNTSLAMARDLVLEDRALERMKALAADLRQKHCMFAVSEAFEKAYILELSRWTEGMPLKDHQMYLKKFKLPLLVDPDPSDGAVLNVVKPEVRDIAEFGKRGLCILSDIGPPRQAFFDGCTGCGQCLAECPEKALSLEEIQASPAIRLKPALCNGTACRRCERICPEEVFELSELFHTEGWSA